MSHCNIYHIPTDCPITEYRQIMLTAENTLSQIFRNGLWPSQRFNSLYSSSICHLRGAHSLSPHIIESQFFFISIYKASFDHRSILKSCTPSICFFFSYWTNTDTDINCFFILSSLGNMTWLLASSPNRKQRM